MIAVLWCAIYIAVIVLVGYATTSAVLGPQRRSIVEIAGLSVLLGMGVTGMCLLGLSLIGLRPTRAVIFAMGIIAAAVIAVLQTRRRLVFPSPLKFDRPIGLEALILIPPLVLLILANLAVDIPVLSYDYFEWDGCVIWGFKAKVLHVYPLLWHSPDYFHDVRLSFTHLDYPLLWPMLIAGAYGAMNQPMESLGKIVVPVLFAGQSLLAYSGARLWLGRFGSVLLAVLFVGPAFGVVLATCASADTPLTAFYLGSVIYLIRWVMQRRRDDIILAALFTGFFASTKTEGLPLAVIHMLVMFVAAAMSRERKNWKYVGLFTLIVSVFVVFWIAWRWGLPHTNDNYASRLTPSIFAHNFGRVDDVLGSWMKAFLNIQESSLLWILLPIMAALGFRAFGQRESRVLWLLLVLHLSLYMLVYIITHWDLNELLLVTSQRLLLHITPIVMLLIAVHWRAAERIIPPES